jgi:hypothetical protein
MSWLLGLGDVEHGGLSTDLVGERLWAGPALIIGTSLSV